MIAERFGVDSIVGKLKEQVQRCRQRGWVAGRPCGGLPPTSGIASGAPTTSACRTHVGGPVDHCSAPHRLPGMNGSASGAGQASLWQGPAAGVVLDGVFSHLGSLQGGQNWVGAEPNCSRFGTWISFMAEPGVGPCVWAPRFPAIALAPWPCRWVRARLVWGPCSGLPGPVPHLAGPLCTPLVQLLTAAVVCRVWRDAAWHSRLKDTASSRPRWYAHARGGGGAGGAGRGWTPRADERRLPAREMRLWVANVSRTWDWHVGARSPSGHGLPGIAPRRPPSHLRSPPPPPGCTAGRCSAAAAPAGRRRGRRTRPAVFAPTLPCCWGRVRRRRGVGP